VARKRSSKQSPGRGGTDASRRSQTPSEEELQGPPPAEALYEPSDLERRVEEERREHHETSPKLSGGDVDADWQRAHLDGEEAVGGTVATPDQNVVDDLNDAVGLPRGLDEEVRTAAEILDKRDADRSHQEG
jgi:hypothetical protein